MEGRMISIILKITLIFYSIKLAVSDSGFPSDVLINKKFSCPQAAKEVFIVKSEMQCTQRCLRKKCKLLNYNMEVKDENNCEVFTSTNDCSTVIGVEGWKAVTFQIDRCQASLCKNGGICVTTDNSYACHCTTAYAGQNCDQDADECAAGTHNCNVNSTCTNTVGSFSCKCNNGYTGDGVTCADINECATGTDNCHANAICINSFGNFSCACGSGFAGNGLNCTDIDECATGTNNCSVKSTCANTVGSFSCTCNSGYAGDGVTCADVNECTTGTHNCHSSASCTNSIGSFSCACDPNFTGNGVSCSDINECINGTHNCHKNATCINLYGGFSCACNNGWSGNGFTCSDVNECTIGTDNCHVTLATCTNTVGSFSCNCRSGYTGNGITCTDVNECILGTHDCHSNATCTNTVGSFSCACKPGFTGNGKTCKENLSYRKPSNQSSTNIALGVTLDASLANDGNRDGRWQVCAWTTGIENTSWWMVDIGRVAAVRQVIIRSGSTFEPLLINPFNIAVGNDDADGGVSNPRCVDSGTLSSGTIKTFNCPSVMNGRYVTVFIERADFLQVCELEVYD